MSPASTTLLVCDDTEAKRYVISSWLRRAGYDVIGAGSAGEALETMATRSVDLVVLDVHLPDRSGLEVAMELKSSAETAAIPIVHISAVAMDPEHRSAGLDRGADAYLVDPIEPQELVSTVGALLRSSGARRRAESLATRLGRLNRAVAAAQRRHHRAPPLRRRGGRRPAGLRRAQRRAPREQRRSPSRPS